MDVLNLYYFGKKCWNFGNLAALKGLMGNLKPLLLPENGLKYANGCVLKEKMPKVQRKYFCDPTNNPFVAIVSYRIQIYDLPLKCEYLLNPLSYKICFSRSEKYGVILKRLSAIWVLLDHYWRKYGCFNFILFCKKMLKFWKSCRIERVNGEPKNTFFA